MTRTITLVLAGAVALVLVFGSGWWLAARDASQRANIEQMERDAATQERLRDADKSTGDADDDRDWLGRLLDGLRTAD